MPALSERITGTTEHALVLVHFENLLSVQPDGSRDRGSRLVDRGNHRLAWMRFDYGKETYRLTEQVTNGEASGLGATYIKHENDIAEKTRPIFKLTHYRPVALRLWPV